MEKEDNLKQSKIGPYHLELRDDGIVFCRISCAEPERVALHEPLVNAIGKLTGYKKAPLLAYHDEFAFPSGEVRRNWAKKETNPYSSAEAFIIKSTALKLISNFYLRIEKPGRPTKMFTNDSEAIKWLRSFL